jgi:hypothetical protein
VAVAEADADAVEGAEAGVGVEDCVVVVDIVAVYSVNSPANMRANHT